jgi:putative SOS response-associated peptidase YedK
MCGRYVFVPGQDWADQISHYKTTSPDVEGLPANYNVAPMQIMPVITKDGIEMMKWGLVPSWAKEFKPAFTSINARAETAAEKPLYRTPFLQHRCLVPASGFYEWQQRPTFKQPYLFKLTNRDMFNFAGLFDIWIDKDENPHYSFTILTTMANKTMSPVHDRMPVILKPEEEAIWLNDEELPENLQLLCDAYDDADMTGFEVSRDVANVKNNTDALLLPLNSK